MNNLKRKFIVSSIAVIMGIFCCKSVFATALADYENELESIKKQLQQNAKEKTGVEQEIATYNYELVELDGKMVEYSKQLASLEEKVDQVNSKLEKYESSLQNTSELYNSAEDTYTTRVKAIYVNGIPSFLDILFSSKGITDFFSRLNVYESILEYDKSLISNMKNQKEYIDYIKKDIEVQKLQLDQLKYDVQKSTDVLNATIETKQSKVESLNKSLANLSDLSDELEAKKKEAAQKVEDEIQRIAKEAAAAAAAGNGTSFSGSQFVWPVDGYKTITTRFGEVYNLVVSTGSAHTGCDIAGSGINTKPIRAIESGTVTTATFSNYGYGNYIIINHGKCLEDGNNYISLYGHCSSLTVSKGKYVNKGDIIGYVGSSGNSTGPHLHLEVRINGKIVNPLQFYPSINFYFPYG